MGYFRIDSDNLPNRNSTVTTGLFSPQPDTYWGQFDEISKYNVQLNFAERMWAAWYAYMQNDVLATGVMSFVMHEMVYFGRSLPWMIADRLPWLRKYKIQNVRHPPFFAKLEAYADCLSSKKSPQQLNNGIAPNSSCCRILPLSSLKSGSSTHSLNIAASQPPCPFLPSLQWLTKSPSSSSWRTHGTTGLTVPFTPPSSTR